MFHKFERRKRRAWLTLAGLYLLGTIVMATWGAWVYGQFIWALFIPEEILVFALLWFLLLSPIYREEQEYLERVRPWWQEFKVERRIAEETKQERTPGFRKDYVRNNWRRVLEDEPQILSQVREKLEQTDKMDFFLTLKGGKEVLDFYTEPLKLLSEAKRFAAGGASFQERVQKEKEEAEIWKLREELLNRSNENKRQPPNSGRLPQLPYPSGTKGGSHG